MRSAKARLIGASYRLRHLVEHGFVEEALDLGRNRPWMGPFEPGHAMEEIPAHVAGRLHHLLDLYIDALETRPPDRELALLVCELHQAVVDRVT